MDWGEEDLTKDTVPVDVVDTVEEVTKEFQFMDLHRTGSCHDEFLDAVMEL